VSDEAAAAGPVPGLLTLLVAEAIPRAPAAVIFIISTDPSGKKGRDQGARGRERLLCLASIACLGLLRRVSGVGVLGQGYWRGGVLGMVLVDVAILTGDDGGSGIWWLAGRNGGSTSG
jgi:hypothetical protein